MKSNLFTRILLSLTVLMASGPVFAMGKYYEADPKAVTTEEKINHYLYYLINHGLTSFAQTQSFQNVIPELFERAMVDGARMAIPDLLGAKTPTQKRLVNFGIEGVRQAVRFSSAAQQYGKQKGKKIKRSDALRVFFTQQLLPSFVRSLVVDLMYNGGSYFAHSLMQRVGYNPETLAASPFTIPGMIYNQVRASGYGACDTLYDFLFSNKKS